MKRPTGARSSRCTTSCTHSDRTRSSRSNRAIAVAELRGPTVGLEEMAALDAERLADYQPYHAARADLLVRAGRRVDAIAAYDRALALTTNPAERGFLLRQRDLVDAGE